MMRGAFRRWLSQEIRADRPYRAIRDGLELFGGVGACLQPWIADGARFLVARGLPPEDGDLVLASVLMRREGILGSGSIRHQLMVKQLRVADDGTQWLACNEGAVPVSAGHRVLGTVISVRRRGWFRPRLSRMVFPLPAAE